MSEVQCRVKRTMQKRRRKRRRTKQESFERHLCHPPTEIKERGEEEREEDVS